MRIIACLIGLVVSISCFSQKYAVNTIPADVKKGANAVVRKSQSKFELLGDLSGVYSSEYAITVFNSESLSDANFAGFYDKQREISGLKISYYDKDGRLIKKVKKSEIEDVNYTSAGSLYDDTRVKYYNTEEYDYPFTVEYSYKFDYDGALSIPSFNPVFREKLGIEQSSMIVVVPSGYELRYKLKNGAIAPLVDKGERDTYHWEFRDVVPLKNEYRGLSASELGPKVLIGLSGFNYEGYPGDMSSWSGYGKWQAELNIGRDVISAEVKSQIDDLIEGLTDPREKAKIIYEYMQSNTRYVSIQLGIGGLQPFSAMDVIDNGYGDCKALTNYTYSLLKYAGIKSNYVKIKAGSRESDIDVDFPSPQSNHVILGVPMEKDTVWLECTSQVAPFNFLGSFTDDRHGLWITEDGKGELVKTPKYKAEQSTQTRKTIVIIDAEGNANVSLETVYKGLQYDDIYRIMDESSEDQRKYLLNVIDLPAFDLGSFSYREDRSTEDPFLTEQISLNARKYASKSGKRLFITPNMLNKYKANPPKDEDRASPIVVGYGYVDVDSVSIKIPEGYRLEFEMEGYEINSDFGSYQLDYNFNPETSELTYIRRLTVKAGEYPAEKYKDYRAYIRKIVKQDKSKLVLIGAT